MRILIRCVAFAFFLLSTLTCLADDSQNLRPVGVAKIDITPSFPIRLNGYYGRNAEATNAAQHLFAKAIAIGSDKEGAAIIVTIDNCIIPHAFREEVVARLRRKAHLDPARIAICVTHTHCAPCLTGAAPNLFGMDIPPADQAHIDLYTRELVDMVEKVSLAALKNRKPASLAWAVDRAGFAANRRTPGGPVDDDLPFLIVTDPNGKLRAILASYACHCTTLGGDFKEFCGDWAGYAQEYLERDHPGAITLVAIGCGADANPKPRSTLALAKEHGREFADAVNHSLTHTPFPLRGPLECRIKQFTLPLDTLPTRAEWETLAKQTNAIGYHARKNIARLDRGEALETSIPYAVQEWNFGEDLAMVFLAGEVVVDYSLRLKNEFDPARLWINAYANEVPGYIPSRRILKEGGYEGGGAMVYYDHPTKFAPAIEDMIVGAVHELTPRNFSFDAKRAQFPPPKSPQDSLAEMRTDAGLKIELVASEPLIESPVAIDWGADGRLWVVEMRDYPAGMDGNWKPGGRIKFLESTHHDGHYDKATIILDNIPFPTGVMPWRNGAMICAAPDILFAESTLRNGYANNVKKLLSGFFTDNYQARVNGLSYGLDNWVYGANGLLGGTISGMSNGRQVDIRGRDFRMLPDTGEFEPVSGLTQQGRARDDWGNWFGCDNSNPLWSYPLPDRYVRRNPFATTPSPRVYAATGSNPNLVHPISPLLERFNQPEAANHVTSGCGLGIYRDNLLGQGFYDSAFCCEPVGNLVYRLKLNEDGDGAVVHGSRAEHEQDAEFLASRDNWFRPVQCRTGPDGAIYVVDMYRFVIEHPRWISRERLAQLDVRAGADMGRIYRIYPAGKKLRPIPNLKKLSTTKLVEALDTPNGIERDLIHIELVQRGDRAAVRPLSEMAAENSSPTIRVQALCILDGLKALAPQPVLVALKDSDAHVRRQAVRLSETMVANSPEIQRAWMKLADDPAVRYQLALSLGEWNDPRAGQLLGKIARESLEDIWIRAAVLSSATRHTAEILDAVLAAPPGGKGRTEMLDQLIATAVGAGDAAALGRVLLAVGPKDDQPVADWQFSTVKSLLDALARKKMTLASLSAASDPAVRETFTRIQPMFDSARKLAADVSAKDSSRVVAIRLLGQDAGHEEADLELLGGLVRSGNPLAVQNAALEVLKHDGNPRVPQLLLADWRRHSPSLRGPIIEILLSREEFAKSLLAAVNSGLVQANEISTANRQRLLKHPSPAVREQAASLFNSGGTRSRAEVMAKYESARRLPGDVARGRVVFGRNCVSCHFLKGQGNAVGPNLAALADKTPADFLLAILDPNAAVEPRFISYDIETRDGRSLSGIINAETATTLTLVQPGGIKETILRSDAGEIRATGLSLMPEGLEQAMSVQDLADLIAYLKSSPAPFGSATAQSAANARARFLADGPEDVARVLSSAEQMTYPSWMGELTMDHCRQTDGKSKVVWQSAPLPADLKPEGRHRFRVAAAMGFLSQPPGRFTLLVNGKPALDFDVSLSDNSWSSADNRVTMTYTVMENNTEDSNGMLVIEIANSLLSPGQPVTFAVEGSATASQRWFGLYLAELKR